MATYEQTTESSQTTSAVHELGAFLGAFGDQTKRERYFLSSVPQLLSKLAPKQELEALTDAGVLTLEKLPRLPGVIKVKGLPQQDGYVLLQKWQGVVKSVDGESFLAELRDLIADGPEEEADFPIDDIPNADKELVAPGAVFYWCIGYLDTLNGQRVRASEIRFRRVPAWTEREVERAKSEAEKLREVIGWK
jgi:hypothetical protein